MGIRMGRGRWEGNGDGVGIGEGSGEGETLTAGMTMYSDTQSLTLNKERYIVALTIAARGHQV